ncbi:MAG: holin, partial [Enterococcus faecalis]|nr:holin [Enterococcus faecalis]
MKPFSKKLSGFYYWKVENMVIIDNQALILEFKNMISNGFIQ